MLTDEERKALVANKVRRSRETWMETQGIIENKFWHAAANRMYYTCYYMVTALLLKMDIVAILMAVQLACSDYISSKQVSFLLN